MSRTNMGPQSKKRFLKKAEKQKLWYKRHFPVGTLVSWEYITAWDPYMLGAKTAYGIVIGYDYKLQSFKGGIKLLIYSSKGVDKLPTFTVDIDNIKSIQKPI